MMFGVLIEVTELTTCLQTTGQPIQHRVARKILSVLRALKSNFEQVTGELQTVLPFSGDGLLGRGRDGRLGS